MPVWSLNRALLYLFFCCLPGVIQSIRMDADGTFGIKEFNQIKAAGAIQNPYRSYYSAALNNIRVISSSHIISSYYFFTDYIITQTFVLQQFYCRSTIYYGIFISTGKEKFYEYNKSKRCR